MADVKDILGVPRGSGPGKSDTKKEKERIQRPAGMSREAFALLDGSHPIVPTLAGDLRKKNDQGFKQKRKSSSRGQVTWQWQPFVNQGRTDTLQLEHWVKCYKDPTGKVRPAETGDYQYAKYNKKMIVYQYNEEEWENVIVKDPDWSREETDYLLSLCDQLELRFLIINDRYEYQGGVARNMEDLKARYYSIARQLMVAREGGQEDIENRTLIKQPFDAAHERERKHALELLLQRTPQQEAEEDVLLEEARVIEEARRQEDAQRRANAPSGSSPPLTGATTPAVELLQAVEFRDIVALGTPSLLGPDLQPLRPPKPGVYCRRAHAKEQAQAMAAAMPGGARGAKMLESMLAELEVANPPTSGSRSACGTWLALQSEIIATLDLKIKVQSRQGGNTPGNSSADARSKRPAKAKAGTRYDDDVEMPKDKRPRTAKKFADD